MVYAKGGRVNLARACFGGIFDFWGEGIGSSYDFHRRVRVLFSASFLSPMASVNGNQICAICVICGEKSSLYFYHRFHRWTLSTHRLVS